MENASPTTRPGISLSAQVALVSLAVAALVYLVLPGIRWGLPSEERNRLTFGEDRAAWRGPNVPQSEAESPWQAHPNSLRGGPPRTGAAPRSAYNPIRTWHPDEYVFLKSLSSMQPSEWNFDPGFFGWPALQFYVVGAALKASAWMGWADLVPKVDYYCAHPRAIARLYEVGRVVTLLFAAGCLILIWRAGARLLGAAGGVAAALLFAVTPLFAVNAHYLTTDVPMLFWILLVLLFSTHILEGGGRRWYLLAGAALGLAAATRYQGAAAAFLIAAAHLMRPDGGPTWRERFRRFPGSGEVWLAAAVSIAVFLACNPYILARPAQFAQEFAGELHGSGAGGRFALEAALFAETGLGLIYGIAILAALCLAAVRRDRAVVFILIGFGAPALLLCAARPVMARYTIPVLPLPALLVAWALATVHRRGMELGGHGAKLAAPVLLASVLILTAQQSLAFSRLYSDPACDTRMRAGEWISQNVPAGASIGVVSEPWQFELPPLDARKYKVVIVVPKISAAGMQPELPDYIITSDLQFPPVGLQDESALGEEGKAFRREATEGGSRYEVAKRFESWPFGQKEFLRYGPHDMRYADPAITVAARRAEGATRLFN